MKSFDDLLHVRFNLVGLVTLDMERIEDDPKWQRIAMNYDLTDNESKKVAIGRYLNTYLSKDDVLANCPATNGPADLITSNIESMYLTPNT